MFKDGHLNEEKAIVPTFLTDLPIFDEYVDDYNDDFLELPILCASSKSNSFQKFDDSIPSICLSYNMLKEENVESTRGNSLPLSFSSFKLLKENFKFINEI